MIIMKKVRIGILVIALIALSYAVFAAQMNSTSYKQTVTVSAGGENVSGASYKIYTAVGIISKIINSTSYINKLGFFHLWLLADNQPCASASQCEGGYCCSSLCKSSACPTPEPTPSPGGTTGGGGGGGGGGGALPNVTVPHEEPKITKDFSVSPGAIKEHIALGAAKTDTIKIKNKGDGKLEFNLNVLTVNDFVFLSEGSFSLEAGEEKTVEVNIIGKKLGSYFGEIEVESGGLKKSIGIVVEVESELVLFDAKIDIPPDYKEVKAGGELRAQITLLNVGPPRKVDVTTTFLIKDRRGNILYEESETFAVEKQTSFVKSFRVPGSLQPDDYLAIVEVRYENSFAVSSELFKVVGREPFLTQIVAGFNVAYMVILIIFAVLAVLFVYLKKRGKSGISK